MAFDGIPEQKNMSKPLCVMELFAFQPLYFCDEGVDAFKKRVATVIGTALSALLKVFV